MGLGTNLMFDPSEGGQPLLIWTETMVEGANACGPCQWPPATFSGTVTFSTQTTIKGVPSTGSPDDFFDASSLYIEVTFGTSRSKHNVQLDPNCQARFPASELSAAVVYPILPNRIVQRPFPLPPITILQPSVVVQATVGRNHASNFGPTRTVRPALVNQVSPWILIPPYAISAEQIRSDSNSFIIEFSRWADVSGDCFTATLNSFVPTPVPRPARYFRVIDQGNLTITDYGAVRFNLQL